MKVVATRNVFTYDELEPDAQQNALGLLCEQAWLNLDSDQAAEELNGWFVYFAAGDDAGCVGSKQVSDKYGVSIEWSLSYSQSDYAAISGKLHRSDLPNLAWPEGVTYARIYTTNYGHSRVECVETEEHTQYQGPLVDEVHDMITALNSNLYRQAKAICEAFLHPDYVLEMYRHYNGYQRRFAADGAYADRAFWTDENGEGDK
jgi:hypothetical protein